MWPTLCSLSRLPWQWLRISLSASQTEDCESPQGYSSSLLLGEINLKIAAESRTGQKYQFSLKKTVLAIGVNFICALLGQGWNKREVIYSSLIGTTLPLLPYLSASVISWLLSIGATWHRCERRSCLFCSRSKTEKQRISSMAFCLHANMFFCGFMERLSPPKAPAACVKSKLPLVVAGSRIRLDVQDLFGALFFSTVALLLAL